MCENLTQPPLVYAIILNWNGYSDTSSCLESIEQISYGNLNSVVVDNGSEDDSGRRIVDEYQEVEVLLNQENLGFSGGINAGIRFAIDSGADYVFILNNDTVIPDDQDLIPHLMKPLEQYSNVGITSPLIIRHSTDQIWFLKGKINQKTLNSKHVYEGKDISTFVVTGSKIETDYVPLCAAMIDVELIENVGLLSNEYFLYYEDVDYCRRAREQGYEFLTIADVRVDHKVSQSTGNNLDPLSSYYEARNRLLFRNKFDDSTPTIQFLTGYLIWLVLLIGNRILHLRFRGLKALFKGVFDGLLCRDGRGPYP